MTSDRIDPGAGGPAAHLAERFASDAQALRRRAEQLEAQRPAAAPAGGRGGAGQRAPAGGPSAATCRQMAEACDRVSALFAGARDGVALGALIPLLERTLADERSADARHVYAGALARLRQALGDDEADDEADDGEDDDDDAGDDPGDDAD